MIKFSAIARGTAAAALAFSATAAFSSQAAVGWVLMEDDAKVGQKETTAPDVNKGSDPWGTLCLPPCGTEIKPK